MSASNLHVPSSQDAATRRKNLRLLVALALLVAGCAGLAYVAREAIMPAFYDG